MERFDTIEIYKKYPILKPFVGVKYNSFKPKILFIGESHYLPKECHITNIGKEWYHNKLVDYSFTAQDIAFLSTRNIIQNDVINSENKNPSHSIYRNIGEVFGNVFQLGSYKEALEYISFYNYFPRPAEVCGGSIKNDWFTDNQVAFETLLEVDRILNPKQIVFVSKKAKKAFDSIYYSKDYLKSKEIDITKIKQTPHPSSAWWNKPSKNYDNLSGKEYLIKILKDI